MRPAECPCGFVTPPEVRRVSRSLTSAENSLSAPKEKKNDKKIRTGEQKKPEVRSLVLRNNFKAIQDDKKMKLHHR